VRWATRLVRDQTVFRREIFYVCWQTRWSLQQRRVIFQRNTRTFFSIFRNL